MSCFFETLTFTDMTTWYHNLEFHNNRMLLLQPCECKRNFEVCTDV